MARYETTIEISTPADEAFAYMADFANTAEWDPGVRTAERLTEGAPRVGSRYAVTSGFYGRAIDLEYEITELDPAARRVVLETESKQLTGRDVIVVTERDGGASVHYDASVNLKGFMRLFDKGLQLAFNGIGDNAAEGMKKRLG